MRVAHDKWPTRAGRAVGAKARRRLSGLVRHARGPHAATSRLHRPAPQPGVVDSERLSPEHLVEATKDEWTIPDDASGEITHIQSPFAQARNYAHNVLGALRTHKRLVHSDVRRQGEAVFAWSYYLPRNKSPILSISAR
jgi:hypothetical protein